MVTTSMYSGSPGLPGSLVRSRTLIARTVFGNAARNASRRKRAEQAQLQQADFFSGLFRRRNRFFHGSRAGAHQHDHALGIRRADVIAQVIRAPGELRKAIHRVLNDGGRGDVKRIRGLARLEKYVGILRACRAASDGPG